jgi:predicted component of type VI protein secretion system
MKKLVSQLFLIFVSTLLLSACSKSENVSEQKKLDPLEIMITPEI